MEVKEDFEEVALNNFQQDGLNELGNIASSHAVTSLAEMTGMTIDMEVPRVRGATKGCETTDRI